MNPAATASHDLLDLAETELVEGRPEATLVLVRQVLADEPGHTGALFLEAEALRDLRDRDQAISCYRALLAHGDVTADTWSGLGHALFEDGQIDPAAKAFAAAIRLDADHPDALWGRGLTRERRGDEAGARRDQLRAWRLSPRYPLPQSIDDESLRDLLADAAADLDEGVQTWLEAAPVIVTDLPDLDTCSAYDPPASPAELLGHVPMSPPSEDGPHHAWRALPPSVFIYRRNLERFASDRAQLVAALRDGVLAQVAEAVGLCAVDE